MHWILPDQIEDTLPAEAEQLETLRRRLLDTFRAHGYRLVAPPMVEFLDALTGGGGLDLGLRTFQLVDQLSGRTLGVRADMTPQVARIDAHLLGHQGVSRLCYCGSVLHALPANLTASREPLQLGAELFGHAGIEADIEIVRLLAQVLEIAEVPASRIDLGHVGIFHALAERAGLLPAREEELFALLQAKDIPGLEFLLTGVEASIRAALLALPRLYGDATVLEEAARVLPADARIDSALQQLKTLRAVLPNLPLSFDLADLRGYHYHTGVVFAAYGAESPSALALGGRYDRIGQIFGRARPATGFSLDLRELVFRLPQQSLRPAILAPAALQDPTLAQELQRLRAAGEIVVEALPGHDAHWQEVACDRKLVKRGEQWAIEALGGEH